MIIKNLTRKSNQGQLVKYVCRYILNPEKNKDQFLIRHNIKSKSINGFIKEFKENADRRIHTRKDQVLLHHTILSWSNKDAHLLNDKKLRAIAKEYIQQRSHTSLFLITKHQDKAHIHLHCVMSGTQLNGKASRISRQEFADLKKNMDLFQQKHFPELTHSSPQHGKAHEEKVVAESKFERFHSKKEEVITLLQDTLSSSRSLDCFLTELSKSGIQPYYRGDEQTLTGVMLENGQKYRLSSLGVKEKVEELIMSQEKEDKELKEIQSLREREIGERDRGEERDILDETENDQRDNADDANPNEFDPYNPDSEESESDSYSEF